MSFFDSDAAARAFLGEMLRTERVAIPDRVFSARAVREEDVRALALEEQERAAVRAEADILPRS